LRYAAASVTKPTSLTKKRYFPKNKKSEDILAFSFFSPSSYNVLKYVIGGSDGKEEISFTEIAFFGE
jgi:hypothetical protein